MSTSNNLLGHALLLSLELFPTILHSQPLTQHALMEVQHPSFDAIALGPYPILQFGAAAIGFLITTMGVLAWFRGERLGKANLLAPEAPPVAELHFDGPLKDIYSKMSDIRAHQLLARLEIKDAPFLFSHITNPSQMIHRR
jgi:hypothetical protein